MTDSYPDQYRRQGPVWPVTQDATADRAVGFPEGERGGPPEEGSFGPVADATMAARRRAAGYGAPGSPAYDIWAEPFDGQPAEGEQFDGVIGDEDGGGGTSTGDSWTRGLPKGSRESPRTARRNTLLGTPRRRKWAAGVTAVAATIGISVAAADGGGPPPQLTAVQAAKTPHLGVEGAANLSKPHLKVAKEYLGEVRDLIATYEPFMLKAANDPRAGDPNTVPNHGDEVIAYMAALISTDPVNEHGPIVWSGYDGMVAKVNEVAKEKGMPELQATATSASEAIETNFIVTLSEIRQRYADYIKHNKGKTVADFVGYFFGGTKQDKQSQQNRKTAEQEFSAWHGQTDPTLQNTIVTDRNFDTGYLDRAWKTLRYFRMLKTPGQASQ